MEVGMGMMVTSNEVVVRELVVVVLVVDNGSQMYRIMTQLFQSSKRELLFKGLPDFDLCPSNSGSVTGSCVSSISTQPFQPLRIGVLFCRGRVW